MCYENRYIVKRIKVMLWFLGGSLNSISNTVYNTVICIMMDFTLTYREKWTEESLFMIKSKANLMTSLMIFNST